MAITMGSSYNKRWWVGYKMISRKKTYKKIGFALALMAIMLFFLFLFYENQENISVTNIYIALSKISNNAVKYASDNSTCAINEDNKSKIILRLDDVKAKQYYDITTNIIDEVLSRNMSISLALIPRDLNKDLKFIYWINKVKNNPKVEIALHGYKHEEEEFKNLNETEAYERLVKGKEMLIKNINVVPITFVPPENVYSDGAEKALVKAGFKIISASRNDVGNNKDLVYLGYTAETYDFETKSFFSADKVLKDCDASLREKDLCVIMIHPQDYLGKDHRTIDSERYNEFLKLLDGIKERNIETKRFADVLNCS